MFQKLKLQSSKIVFLFLLALFGGASFLPSKAFSQRLTGYSGGPGLAQLSSNLEASSQLHSSDRYEPSVILEAPVALVQEEGEQENAVESALAESVPVNLQAEHLTHDEQAQIITASGNVILTQGERILRADEISYNLENDNVRARGDVVLNEHNGDIHYAQEVELNDKLKNGFVKGLKSYLVDGSRFVAREGRRTNGNKTTMTQASYTPCEPCKKNSDKPPVWQIKASKITHDEAAQRVSYQNARFEVFGTPVAYAPYFSHSDGSVKSKSGFLSPSAGYKSELGAFVTTSYYWDIAPSRDVTLGMMAMTKEAPLVLGEYRQRWDNANLHLNAGITKSGRVENKNGIDTNHDEEMRGHVVATGRWDINKKWRSGLNIEWASDDQYMRQYDLSNNDVFKNEFYLERFSGRNYAAGRLLTFQDVRVRETQEDQPEILPEILMSFKGEPDSVPILGGRWSFDGSLLGLRRGGGDPDMNRMSLDAGWERRMVSNVGFVADVSAHIRGDLYNARDKDVATADSGRSRSSREARFYPQIHMQGTYPLSRALESAQLTLEPVVALTVAPNIDVNSDIPNEDSQDVQIDSSNIFEPNRFPGFDRVEDQSRVTYGLRSGLYGYGGSSASLFLGQSMRLQEDDNPFPKGSGLDRQKSDIVGQFSGHYDERYSMDYRFQLSGHDFASQRHEIDTYAKWNRFKLNSRYLFTKALEGTDIDESREQLQAGAYYNITSDWGVKAGGTQDLGERPGLRKAYLGFDYFGQCVSWSLTGVRNLTDDASGNSDMEILFRIGLKNLGEFQTSGFLPDASER